MSLPGLNLSTSAPWKARCIRKLKLSTLISERNPQTLHYVENLTEIRRLKKKQMDSKSNIIHCFSMFRLYYEMWMAVVFISCMVHIPVDVAFSNNYVSLTCFTIVLKCFCLCDIVMRFFTGYLDEKENKVIMDPGKIARNYLRSVYFAADLLSSIPNPVWVDKGAPFYFVIDMLSLLKLVRLVTAFKYVSTTAQYFKVENFVFRISETFFFFFLTCHWTCCGIYLLPQFRKYWSGKYFDRSWLIQWDLVDKSRTQKYIASMYKACGYILGVKQGNSKHLAWEERVLACGCYIGGKIVIYFLTVAAIAKFLRIWSLESKYFGIVQQLEGYIFRKRVPQAIRNRLLTYYKYKFKRTYFEENKIKGFLSDRLRQEINVHILSRFTENIHIFSELPQEALNKIISNLHTEVFLPHDIIIKAGCSGDCMYFLYSGTVAVLTPSGKEVCHLQDGAYFGEISLIMQDQKRTAHLC
ncbi:potassium/sodium hyperpolarization-activated cyclic nucleotide-gated channel 2-like isoform X2 [Tenebrio molitor]|uniref:potassium/sodium hyperpolarization-activated cyclic nucleotide-gated channel 2-like isoform X2 n=1 Tax=Tenebrio molitor TaxID=7067 RepID=UPI0036246CB0